jgi:hypothetical protein
MYLFVFAFLGNVFYVASILLSPNAHLPPPQSTAFLKESIPYVHIPYDHPSFYFLSLVSPWLTT